MTTDITELAQRMKAAAEKATPGRWEYYPGNTSIEYNVDSMDEVRGSIVYVDSGDFTQAQTDRNGEFIALANPVNILALVEALEKAQAKSVERGHSSCDLFGEVISLRERIAEMEPIRAAAEKLVRCKGRYHSEQNYRALAALFGVNTQDLPPLDGESRTVTPVTYSESADADHCRKWAWEQVKGEVSTEDWTTGDSITYFGFFCWGWDMRRQYNEQRPVTVKLPTTMYTEFEGDDFCREVAVLDRQLVIDCLADAGIKVDK
ncbi:hypothetical protein CIG23_17555 [Raoultella planticola]|uniref:ead/Ea22-like family protein n=1 Tax=Raoultella planticola TaxID=575 RepID=UPI000BA149F5|nr:ead/Ea22-like family protein [Raoultella planticola]OZP72387.1 hypothetical protein CIG23_17555 [Raoultella planticola]